MSRLFPILAWALIIIAGLILFDRAMDADARNQCAHPERLGLNAHQQDAVCRQAGVIL